MKSLKRGGTGCRSLGGEESLFRFDQTCPQMYPTETSPVCGRRYGQVSTLQYFMWSLRPGTRLKVHQQNSVWICYGLSEHWNTTFLYCMWGNVAYMFLNVWKKWRMIFCDMWKLHDVQISGSINEASLEHSHVYSFLCHLCLLSHHWQSWKRPYDLQSRRYFTIWSFREKVC